jgi:hypothetical protein
MDDTHQKETYKFMDVPSLQILNFIREKQIGGEIKTREEALKVLKEIFCFHHKS